MEPAISSDKKFVLCINSKFKGWNNIPKIVPRSISHTDWSFLDKISRHIPSQPVYSAEMAEVIEREEGRLRSAHSIDLAYKQFLSNNIQGNLMEEAWYNQVRLMTFYLCWIETCHKSGSKR